eukprot:TRINITY_DN93_c0_g1_i1.p1 TRINITY_DN93_c0_g1~~TRINITY_DN93_c0_g1_i1.p1  ORF type:complete len:656 (-),score=124.98 TRINITY_DN93_c0_g1_i1:508-2475(-)
MAHDGFHRAPSKSDAAYLAPPLVPIVHSRSVAPPSFLQGGGIMMGGNGSDSDTTRKTAEKRKRRVRETITVDSDESEPDTRRTTIKYSKYTASADNSEPDDMEEYYRSRSAAAASLQSQYGSGVADSAKSRKRPASPKLVPSSKSARIVEPHGDTEADALMIDSDADGSVVVLPPMFNQARSRVTASSAATSAAAASAAKSLNQQATEAAASAKSRNQKAKAAQRAETRKKRLEAKGVTVTTKASRTAVTPPPAPAPAPVPVPVAAEPEPSPISAAAAPNDVAAVVRTWPPSELLSFMQIPSPNVTRLRGIPWMRFGGYLNIPEPQRFSAEVVDFCSYVAASRVELNQRMEAFGRVQALVQDLFPGADVEIFGSVDTGLLLPVSDVDCVIQGGPQKASRLQQLAQAIKWRKIGREVITIQHAKVPLVKYIDNRTGYNVDISFDAVNGPANSALVKKFCGGLSSLKPMIILIKSFLFLRGLNDTHSGGIGSYLLSNLVISFLQLRCEDHMSLGDLVMEFFNFYGNKFNYYRVGIQVTDGGAYFAKPRSQWVPGGNYTDQMCLSVMDPQSPENDIGRNSYNLSNVRTEFAEAYKRLHKARYDVGAHKGTGELTPLAVLLFRRYGSEAHELWKASKFTTRFGVDIDTDSHIYKKVMGY